MFWNRIEPRQAQKLRAAALTIDRVERRALIASRPLDLSPLLYRLIEHLAARPGRVVTRAELKRALWPYAERIDTERRLNTAMRTLRKALGDNVEQPQYIETVRGYGYRWIADQEHRRNRGGLIFAAALAVSLSLPTRPAPATPDLATTLQAQGAMEAWRRTPNAQTAGRASASLTRAGADSEPSPSLLVMRAELELGSGWRWSAAERDYNAALARDPENVDARLGLAWLRVNQGRHDEALALVRGLLDTGVVSGDRGASMGWLLIRVQRPDLAASICGGDAAATINDLSCSHQAFAELGRYVEAKAIALRLMNRVSARAASINRVRREPPREAYRTFLAWRARSFLPANATAFQKAQVLADAGEVNGALRALQRSVAAREPMAVKIRSTPSFTPLHGDVRFERLVAAVQA